MLYLVGIDHLVQYENGIVPCQVFSEFRIFVKGIVRAHDIDLIAEEFHEDYLDEVYHSREATLRTLALDMGKGHLFCDPGDEDRRRLGIPCYADLKDAVKERLGSKSAFIVDDELRKKVQAETDREVVKYWDLRENFWLERMALHLERNILFLCGHEHVQRFAELLSARGVPVRIVEHFWKGEFFRSM